MYLHNNCSKIKKTNKNRKRTKKTNNHKTNPAKNQLNNFFKSIYIIDGFANYFTDHDRQSELRRWEKEWNDELENIKYMN